MRELKFRVWEKNTETMFDWDQLESMKYLLGDKSLMKPFIVVPNRDCDEVMQFTGLKDNLHKEIYTGDVVNWGDDVFEVVVFEEGCFCTESSMLCSDTMQVVGNIYENPELL